MDVNLLKQWALDGITDPAQISAIEAAFARDTFKTKAASLKAENEYAELQTRSQQLQQALEGGPGKPGAKAYQEWYDKNYTAVQKLQEDNAKYLAKYGTPDGTPPTPQATPQQMAVPTEADIQRMVDDRIQKGYAPRWASTLKETGAIVQKHMYAKRQKEIDFDALEKLAVDKHNGSLQAAYDEWDAPERIKQQETDKEAEFQRRLKEERQKWGARESFPAGGDFTPGALSSRTKAETDKFDKGALLREMANTFAGTGAPEN